MLLDIVEKTFNKLQNTVAEHKSSKEYISETFARELRTPSWLKDAAECVTRVNSYFMDDEKHAQYIKFLIFNLVREMQAFYLFHTNARQDITLRNMLWFPYAFEQQNDEKPFMINDETVITYPWSTSRLLDSMVDIEKYGYNSECETTRGILFKELNLVIITSHNHHPAAAIYSGATKKMTITGPVINLADMTEDIFITADFHFATSNGTALEKDSDPRFVLAAYLGQILGRMSY